MRNNAPGRLIPQFILLFVVLIVFAVLLVWPVCYVLKVAFLGVGPNQSHFTLAYLAGVFREPGFRAGLFNSALIASCVTTLAMLIAVPLAILSVRYDFRGKSLLSGLLLVPLVLPPFVGALGLRQILGRFGALTAIAHQMGFVGANQPIDWIGAWRAAAVVLVEALSLYPILYLNVSAALANLDPAMEQAAANLGASRWTIFKRITLPLIKPGIFAGGAIVLIWSFTELGTPLMFDFYRVTPVQVFQRLNQVDSSPMPYALTFVMLAGSLILYAASRWAIGGKRGALATKSSNAFSARRLHGLRAIAVSIPFLLVISLALLPHAGVILLSFSKVGSWYQSALPQVFTVSHHTAALTHEVAYSSVQNSVFLAGISTCLDLLLGLAIAWLIVRSSLPGRKLIDSLAMLPLAVPGLVMAFGYLALGLQIEIWIGSTQKTSWAHGSMGAILAWLRQLANARQDPRLLLIFAYALRRLPYVVRSAVAGLEQTPVDLELAAKNIGASGGTTLRRITIPLISANLIAGGLLAFAFAMLEVSDSLILAQQQKYWPITKAIFELFQRLVDGPYIAAALGVWAMVLLTLTLLAAGSLLGKRMGAMFRV